MGGCHTKAAETVRSTCTTRRRSMHLVPFARGTTRLDTPWKASGAEEMHPCRRGRDNSRVSNGTQRRSDVSCPEPHRLTWPPPDGARADISVKPQRPGGRGLVADPGGSHGRNDTSGDNSGRYVCSASGKRDRAAMAPRAAACKAAPTATAPPAPRRARRRMPSRNSSGAPRGERATGRRHPRCRRTAKRARLAPPPSHGSHAIAPSFVHICILERSVFFPPPLAGNRMS